MSITGRNINWFSHALLHNNNTVCLIHPLNFKLFEKKCQCSLNLVVYLSLIILKSWYFNFGLLSLFNSNLTWNNNFQLSILFSVISLNIKQILLLLSPWVRIEHTTYGFNNQIQWAPTKFDVTINFEILLK